MDRSSVYVDVVIEADLRHIRTSDTESKNRYPTDFEILRINGILKLKRNATLR